MRPITLEQLTPDADNPLSFAGSHGELLRIDVLDHDLIRVSVRPDGVARLDRTWTVVGYDGGDTPREGRLRDDLTPFPRPNHAVTRANGTVRVRTDALTLTLDLADARIAWQTRIRRRFAPSRLWLRPRGAFGVPLYGAAFGRTLLRLRRARRNIGQARAANADEERRCARLQRRDGRSALQACPVLHHIHPNAANGIWAVLR